MPSSAFFAFFLPIEAPYTVAYCFAAELSIVVVGFKTLSAHECKRAQGL